MSQGTNEIEDAFSDLIAEYFDENKEKNSVENINVGPVLDWDSVANGQLYTNVSVDTKGLNLNENNKDNKETVLNETNKIRVDGNGLFYNNLENICKNELNNADIVNKKVGVSNKLYENMLVTDNESNTIENQAKFNELYNKLENPKSEKTVENVYGVVVVNGETLKGLDDGANKNIKVANTETVINNSNTGFKLTQGNLPARIGFWTKVRNFFLSDSKIQYSLQQPQSNNGLWNKIQNFFSFEKSK